MRGLRWMIGVLLCLVVAALTQAQEVQPVNRLYFYNADTLYLIDLSTTVASMEPIAAFRGAITCARWAGNGEWLILSARAEESQGIYHLNRARVEVQTPLTNADFGEDTFLIGGCPLVSPDGAWVSFRTSNEDTYEGALHVMKPDGTEQRELVAQMEFGSDSAGLVRWSYDSQWMIFYAGIEGEFGYWRIRPDGTDLELIDADMIAQLTAAVSPDEAWAAYWHLRDNGGTLWTENLADSESTVIFALDGEVPFPPVWDGQELLILSMDWNAGTLVMRRVSHDGTEVSQVFEIPFELAFFTGIEAPAPPLWSPDGQWALISQTAQLLDTFTGELVTLPFARPEAEVLWSDDGDSLWYVGIEENTANLYRFNVDTQEATQVRALVGVGIMGSQGLGWWPE